MQRLGQRVIRCSEGDTVTATQDWTLSIVFIVQVTATTIPEVLLIEPTVFGDERGFFFESFNQKKFQDETGLTYQFVQDNHSRSRKNILRGLHYQIQQAQGKLIRVVTGAVYDVAVDLRRSSPHFGQWVGVTLTAENKHQLWIPPGFGHGFYVLSEVADVLYKATDFYAPQYDRSLRWDDPDLSIAWPLLEAAPILSAKDQNAPGLALAEVYD